MNLICTLIVVAALLAPTLAWSATPAFAPSSALNRQQQQQRSSSATRLSAAAAPPPTPSGPYVLPPLPYDYTALEPQIDVQTMTTHHSKHHQTYITNLNNFYKGPVTSILDLQKDVISMGNPVRNNAGGHYNHGFFWSIMEPSTLNSPISPALKTAIDRDFGGLATMRSKFDKLAAPGATFGSGWVWLAVNPATKGLELVSTANQDNPLMLNASTNKGISGAVMLPILGLDLWEHAYYLKYQNRRPEYVTAWWDVVSWGKVSEYYDEVLKTGKGIETSKF